jgi:uncharacterized protein YdaU (DUF1376 family)
VNGLPYYKAYPRDFIEGTIGMAFELKGAYRLVLDLIYMQNGRLPDDARYISGQLGCTVRAWNGYRAKLIELGKLTAENGVISNFRASLELDNLREISRKNSENASLPRKNKGLGLAVAKRTQSHTEPDTEPKKERTPPPPKGGEREILCAVMSEESADDFIAHRKSKKARLTERAARMIADELRGHPDPDAVVRLSVMNGWTGVFPERVAAKPSSQSDLSALFAKVKAANK